MKPCFFLFAFSLAAGSLFGAEGATPPPAVPALPIATPGLKRIDYLADPSLLEYAKQAGSQAIEMWMTEFSAKQFSAKRYAVLPLGADVDDSYFTLQARNEFTRQTAGTDYTLYTRDDPEWKALLAEVRRGDQEGDTMQPETIQKFGRIQGVQALIRGRVAGVYLGDAPSRSGVRMEDDPKILQVRIVLQAFEVETGRLLWGSEKTAALLLADDGLVVPGTKRQWILYGAVGLGGLIVLMILARALKSANRPR